MGQALVSLHIKDFKAYMYDRFDSYLHLMLSSLLDRLAPLSHLSLHCGLSPPHQLLEVSSYYLSPDDLSSDQWLSKYHQRHFYILAVNLHIVIQTKMSNSD